MEDSWTFLHLAILLFSTLPNHGKTSALGKHTHKSHLGSHVTESNESNSLLRKGRGNKRRISSRSFSFSSLVLPLRFRDIYIYEHEAG